MPVYAAVRGVYALQGCHCPALTLGEFDPPVTCSNIVSECALLVKRAILQRLKPIRIPKQIVAIAGQRSGLTETACRFECNQAHKILAAEDLIHD